MAKVRDNLVTEGLSGKLGKRLVFRKGRKGKTILATLPVENDKRQFNDAQKAHQGAFKKAIAYAKVAKTQPLYVALGKQVDEAAYNLAVADWFGQPEVLELDSAGWRGQAGQTIRIRAEGGTIRDRWIVVGVHQHLHRFSGFSPAYRSDRQRSARQ
jgi:hypothetical protein